MDTKKLIKQIEQNFDFSNSQTKIQNEVLEIVKLAYRLAETGRNISKTPEDKEFWNDLRRVLYEALTL